MKIKQKTKLSKTKILAIVAACVLLIVGGFLGFMYMKKTGPFASDTSMINYGPSTAEERQAGEEVKDQYSKSTEGINTNAGSDQSPAPTPTPDGSKSTVGVEVTAANQNGNVLNIRTLIQTVSSDGTCMLTMSGPSSKQYSATSDVQAGPTTSTCKGFDVPTSALSAGKWTITIQYEDTSSKGSSTKDITVL